jgi:uncharacterized protein YacL (UPF0231 family)
MGHESIGRWFSDELSNNKQHIASLIENIERVEKRVVFEKEYLGIELRLTVTAPRPTLALWARLPTS